MHTQSSTLNSAQYILKKYLKNCKIVELVSGGSVINRAYPAEFNKEEEEEEEELLVMIPLLMVYLVTIPLVMIYLLIIPLVLIHLLIFLFSYPFS